MYRQKDELELFLVHPGGPFFVNKDDGSWTIPKGLIGEDEEVLDAARREFEEETGIIPHGPFIPLDHVKQKGGKVVWAWAFEGNVPGDYRPESNLFEIEWPPKSGKRQSFPEIDKAQFFPEIRAREKINPAQQVLISRLTDEISGS